MYYVSVKDLTGVKGVGYDITLEPEATATVSAAHAPPDWCLQWVEPVTTPKQSFPRFVGHVEAVILVSSRC